MKPASRPRPLQVVPQVHRVTHRIGLHIAATLGISQAEAHVLQHLASHGDCTVGDLHRAFAHRRSTLTSVLDRLAGRGLIARQSSPTDRRTFDISLTTTGSTLALKVHAELQAVETTVLATVGVKGAKSFTALLTALEDTLAASEDLG